MSSHSGFIGVVGLSGIQTLVRLGLGLISVKVTAVAFGPEGIGLIAQLGTFISLVGGLLANGAATAVINLFHRNRDRANGLQILANQCSWIVLIGFFTALFLAIFSSFLNSELLGQQTNIHVILVGLLVIPIFVAGSLMQSWVNANESINALYFGQIGTSVLGFLFLYWAASAHSLNLALTAVATSYALPAIWFAFYWIYKLQLKNWLLNIRLIIPSRKSLQDIDQIFKFYPMLLVHSAAMPLILLLVRWVLIETDGGDAMGIWQAGWRLSELYVGMITMAAASYFAPKLAKTLGDPSAYWQLVRQLFLCVLGLVVGSAFILFLTRSWLIPLIFSERFIGTVDLMPAQLLSDIPRALHWCVGLVLVSCLARRDYIVLEIVSVVLLFSFLFFLKDKTPFSVGYAFLFAFSISSGIGAVLLLQRKMQARI